MPSEQIVLPGGQIIIYETAENNTNDELPALLGNVQSQTESEQYEVVTVNADEFDEVLIDLVRQYPHLYNKMSAERKDAQMARNSWHSIATALSTTADLCEKRWKALRNQFTKKKREIEFNTRSGAGQNKIRPFKFMEQLQFLNDHVIPRMTVTNIASGSEIQKSTFVPNTKSRIQENSVKVGSPSPSPNTMFRSGTPNSFLSSCESIPSESEVASSCADNSVDGTISRKSSLPPQNVEKKGAPKRKKQTEVDPLLNYLKETDKAILSSDSAEANFGAFVGAELLKLPEPYKMRLMSKFMSALTEVKEEYFKFSSAD